MDRNDLIDSIKGSIKEGIVDFCRFSVKGMEFNSKGSTDFFNDFYLTIESIILRNIENYNLSNVLIKMYNTSERLFKHSVRTATLSVIIGYRLSLPPRELDILSLGGLLHDIGMVELIEIDNTLDTYFKTSEQLKFWYLHPMVGYNYINKNLQEIPFSVRRIVLLHHVWRKANSNFDRRSFPEFLEGKRLTGKDKDNLVDIVQISNYIESMDNKGKSFPSILTELNRLTGTRFGLVGEEVLYLFSPYAIGDYVIINSRHEGRVVKHTNNPLRPIIECGNEQFDLSNIKRYNTLPHLQLKKHMPREEFMNSEYSCNG